MMPHIAWLGFVVIICVLQKLRAELVIMSYDVVIKDKLIPRYTSVLSGYKSGVVCAKKCLAESDCLSFAFNTIRKECYLYDSYMVESVNATDDLGTQTFNGCFNIPIVKRKYVGMTYVIHSVDSITSLQMCIDECNQNSLCTASAYREHLSNCILYRFPVVEVKLAPQDTCRDSCIINSKCLTMVHTGNECYLYSVTADNLNVISGYATDTIAEKASCYPV